MRRHMITRGAHVQRNGSQILCVFVVSHVQRRIDREDMHARMLRFCTSRVDEAAANSPRA